MKPKKVFINNENEGEIACPSCGKTKKLNVSHYKTLKKSIKVKCNCDYTFSILLEYRKYQRKEVRIPGKIFQIHSDNEMHDVTITSLSVSGVGFEIRSFHNVKVDDIFDIQFKLDDDLDSTICEEIVIKRVHGNFVGAEFHNQDAYIYELDFYIMSPQVFS